MNQSWRKIRERIKGAWSDVEFEDDNMTKARGNPRRMVTLVQSGAREARDEIRRNIVGVM